MKIPETDLKRFSKQIILKDVNILGQEKIFLSKVLVVGVGGLGCPLIMYLANAGIGNIGLVDDDKIDITNLNRQILFTTKDLGKFKVIQAKKLLEKINKKIKINIYKERLIKKNINKIFKNFDIICDGTDNFETRYLINDYCLKNKKVLISAAISKFDGQIFNFNFKKKIPCFRCFMPEIPEEENNCQTDGIMSTVAGIAGTLQANEVIKTILNKKNNLIGKVLIFNGLNTEFRTIKISKNSKCIKECTRK
ncbi:MAG: HesA/MoeB/ThiF family protein [Pelagibacteraceae bacterium]